MKYRVIIETRAAGDLQAHFEWIEAQGAPLNAERWLEGVMEAIQSLATMPNRCPLAPENGWLGLEIRQHVYGSHRILFTIHGRVVSVLHIRHASRRPLNTGIDPPSTE